MIKVKYLDKEQRNQVGFTYIMDKLEVMTAYGLEEKKDIMPFRADHRERLIKELNNIEVMIESMKENKGIYGDIERILCKLKDIKQSVKRCKRLEVLDEVELYEIKYFSLLLNELLSTYESLNIHIDNIRLYSLEEVFSILDPEGKKIPTFYIYDNYSEKLQNIREEKTKIEKSIIIEEDAEAVIMLKEERLDIVILEEEEELRIRTELTKKINKYVHILEDDIESIGKLDLLMAKCKLAMRYNAVKPEITKHMDIVLEEAINPEIEEILQKKGKDFTPVSITLTSGTTVITGANMGGKSVTLKTIVLNLLLAQMGFFVFSKSAKLPILEFVYFVSDDMQSVTKGLSTFGAEIIKLKEVIECIKDETGFVALDEFARGTNPKEGLYLVKSLCKYLASAQSISLVSTHYDGVVADNMVHYQVKGLKNVDFKALKYKIDLNKKHSVEIIQENMDYRLERVSKESSVPKDALNISMLLGLDEELLSIAKGYYKENELN